MDYEEEEYYEEEVIEEDVYEEDYEEEIIEEIVDESEGEYEEFTVMTEDVGGGQSPFDPQGWRQQGLVQSAQPVAPSSSFTPRILPPSDTFTPQVVSNDPAPPTFC